MVLLLKLLILVVSFFLVVLILLQRGRGGGLAGALGGMGGQSAFGSKAGDVFTRITSVVAVVWIVLCVGALKYVNAPTDLFDPNAGGNARPAEEAVERQAGTTPAGKGTTPAAPAQPAEKSGTSEE